MSTAGTIFWMDLERDLEDPFYRRAHIAATLLIASIDAKAGDIDVQPVEDGSIPS